MVNTIQSMEITFYNNLTLHGPHHRWYATDLSPDLAAVEEGCVDVQFENALLGLRPAQNATHAFGLVADRQCVVVADKVVGRLTHADDLELRRLLHDRQRGLRLQPLLELFAILFVAYAVLYDAYGEALLMEAIHEAACRSVLILHELRAKVAQKRDCLISTQEVNAHNDVCF